MFFKLFTFLILSVQSNAERTNRTLYFAVIVDEFEDPFKVNGSEANHIVLSRETALDIFLKATDAGKRLLTSIGGNTIGETTLLHTETSQTHWRNFSNNVNVNIKPIFVEFGLAKEMYDSISEGMAAENETGELRAVIEMGICTASKCVQTKELADKFIPPNASVFSLCCYDPPSHEDLHVHHTGPKLLYDGLEPHSLVHLTYLLAVRFKWRRFHFVISPYWPTFDQFYEAFTEGYEEIGAEYADQMPNGDLIYTKSYFCTEYLAKGNLCSDKHAHDIVLRQSTVTIILMDIEKDLPYFIRQLKTISAESLSQGKAVIVANPRGIVRQLYDVLKEDAPDGLMMIKTRTVPYDDFKMATVEGFPGMGVDGVLYNQLRMISRAAEIMEQQPGEYTRISNFFCGTKFTFDDSTDYIGYAEHCERDWVVYEIFNVKRDPQGNASLEIAFTVEDRVLFERSKTPHWFGSRERVPFEDFCKLDGAGCPTPPADLVPIVTPSVIGFLLVAGAISGLVYLYYRREMKRKHEEEMLRAIVLIKYDDLNFDPVQDRTSSRLSRVSRSGDLITPTAAYMCQTPVADNGNLAGTFSHRVTATSMNGDELGQKLEGLFEKQSIVRALMRGENVLVKMLAKPLSKSQAFTIDQQVVKELIQLRDLHHPNVNQFLGITPDPKRLFVVQTFCAKGTLASVLSRQKIKLNRLFKVSFVSDIAAGMAYLHQSSVHSHGNLNSENILVDARWFCKIANIPLSVMFKRQSPSGSRNDAEFNAPEKNVKIFHKLIRQSISLGLAQNPKVSGDTEAQNNENDKLGHVDSGKGLSEVEPDETVPSDSDRHESYWMAPELLRRPIANRPSRGSQAGDVYSFGVIVSEIISRQKPYAGCNLTNQAIVGKLRSGQLPVFRPKLSQEQIDDVQDLYDLAKVCWDETPIFRPTFQAIVRQLQIGNNGKETNLVDQMIAMLESYAENLEETVNERTRELIEEKKKSEELLSKMLPKYVVDELKAGRVVHPEVYESVTVYFSDIVGFTALASESNPMEIVQLLNDLYSQFDQIIDSHDVYKVETIGDAYMVASGLPQRNGNRHAGEIATMALDIMSCVTHFRIAHRPGKMLQLRCGIHTGPVVAGVVGLKMPRYCLFGDTVNYASRMESSGLALRIHVSPECKQVLDEIGGFKLEERGYVSMKGKGSIRTYFLIGKDTFLKALPDLKLAASIAEHEFK